MSWVTLMAPTLGPTLGPTRGMSGLGSAQVSARWGWAEPRAQAPLHTPAYRRTAPVDATPITNRALVIRAGGLGGAVATTPAPPRWRSGAPAPVVAQSIAEAAQVLGRDESDIWAEAAREWLSHHLGLVAIIADDANDDPPPTAPAAAVAARRAARCWSAIDELLAELRAPAA